MVVLIAFLVVGILYFNVLMHLNNRIFSIEGDGLKNYFNYLYHIKHDSGYLNFEGMNYPYGEDIIMVDCHPLFANILKFISQNIIDISPVAVGILNFFMVMSLVVCALFLYFILNFYKLPLSVSVAGAIAITFLSSQVLVWKIGHYALSYSCFFPIGWYLILKFYSSQKTIKFSILIIVNILFWQYTHAYLGLLLLSFTFFVHLFSILTQKKYRKFRVVLLSSFQILLPFSIIYCLFILLDTHPGRIEMPYLDGQRASFYSVFLPNHSFLKPLYAIFFDLSAQKNQTWCKIGNYIGLSTNIIILYTIFFIGYRFIRTKQLIVNKLFSQNQVAVLLASIILLMYAMAFPFRYGLDFLLPTKMMQFVALGRFAWPFYFVITVFSLTIVYRLFNKKLALYLALIASGLLFIEGLSYHLAIRKKITNCENFFNEDNPSNIVKANIKNIHYNDYQAILPIPFYHQYSTLHSYEYTDKPKHYSMWLSYKSGLPLMSAMLSRPSILESKKILQIFIPPNYNKPIKKDLNKKPLLLLFTKEQHSELEDELLKKTTSVFENDEFQLASLSIDSIFHYDRSKYLRDFMENKDSYFLDTVSGYYKHKARSIIYKSFDKLKNKYSYRGLGSLALEKNSFNTVYQSVPNELEEDAVYNLSFWYYNYIYDQTFNTMWIEVKDSTGKILHSEYFDPAKSNIYDGNWAFNEKTFILPEKSNYVVLCSQGADYFKDSVYIDELLIRQNNMDIYKLVRLSNTLNDVIIKNNETYQ